MTTSPLLPLPLPLPLSALMLLEDLNVEPGQWIAINATNRRGGLAGEPGQCGVHVLNVVRSETAAKTLRELGFEPIFATEGDVSGRTGHRRRTIARHGIRSAEFRRRSARPAR
ncbi:hypothetical protein [Nocardia pseudovaccinii]|uniref:hypothetical protein n=1 Tax=Nocardia pseudovaccinii TaxID=189540 RepID=UPI0012F485F6|nr:hypothetical protein [Nocardia pseudovaccinii]